MIKFMLPHKFRKFSYLFLFLGVFFYFFRLYISSRPSFLEWNMFAVISSSLQTKYFTFIQSNMIEEITLLFLLIAVYLPVLTFEKAEFVDYFTLRIESIATAFFSNLLLNIFGLFFIFGFAYIWVLIINLFTLPIIYFCSLQIKIYKYKIRSKN